RRPAPGRGPAGAAMTAILEIERLSVALAGAASPLLTDIDLEVRAGEIHGLVGESGAGKTMIGRAILGLLPSGIRPTAGRIAFGGTDLARLSQSRRRALLGRDLALVPQDPLSALNPSRRIGRQ